MRELEWEDCYVTPRHDPELDAAFKKVGGIPPFGIEYMASSSWLAHSFTYFNPAQGILLYTDLDFAERIWMAVSQDNSCRYCYAAHRTFLRILGYSNKKIRKMEEEIFSADTSERERMALQFARKVSRASPPPLADDRREMRDAGFEDPEIDELAVLTTSIIFANRVATLLALPPQSVEAMPDRWYNRLAQPILKRILRSRLYHGAARPLEEHEKEGPYSYLVRALEGLPAAPALRRLIDEAWSSETLPLRTRCLILAVIARGLGCEKSATESTRLLETLDFGADRLEPVLSHLSSPDLDEIERAVLPFARETIRFEPIQIQRKARALREQIGNERFVEVVGFCGLANMLCRLGVVVKHELTA